MLDRVTIASQKVSNPEPAALGINVEKPKFPDYAIISKRLESYETWPEYIPVDKHDLAEAGLVYTGVGDNVRCYFCGGGLRRWESGDVPMVEHAKWYPKCAHVLLVKGHAYVERVCRGEDPEDNGIGNHQGTVEVNCIDSVAAQSCIQMGYTKHIVERAIHTFKRTCGNEYFSAVQLCEIIFDLEDSLEDDYEDSAAGFDQRAESATGNNGVSDEGTEVEDSLESLLEENQRLKENKTCKICMDSRADIIFLPCGHMISCPQCAPALTRCPVCRKTISGHIKTF